MSTNKHRVAHREVRWNRQEIRRGFGTDAWWAGGGNRLQTSSIESRQGCTDAASVLGVPRATFPSVGSGAYARSRSL